VLTAAAVALIAGRAIGLREAPASTDQTVAVVERVDGTPRMPAGTHGDERPLTSRDAVRTGDWIETDGSARVALRFADGTSVRLDRGSRLRALSAGAIELAGGAVYVDTGRASARFEVRTALATARDIGTQFEVRLLDWVPPTSTQPDRALRLRVRTGFVELEHGGPAVSGRAGTEVTFSASGTVTRPIPTHGPAWEWTAGLAPPLEIEGQTLSAFLVRVAHEHGWELRYADPALAREASGIVLHGSVSGLPPPDAVAVAVTTSGLRHRLDDGELVVIRASDSERQE
jgi:ferric-dicitrate binding protein FerR (iron transport regulator)